MRLPSAKPSDDFVRKVHIKRLIDGDTLEVLIDLGFRSSIESHVRLASVNTPEKRGSEAPAGKYVTEQVKEFLSDATDAIIHSKEFKLGAFDRCICDLWVGERCLNDWLIAQGLAWRTDESGQIIGPRSVESLAGIPEGLKQQCRELAA